MDHPGKLDQLSGASRTELPSPESSIALPWPWVQNKLLFQPLTWFTFPLAVAFPQQQILALLAPAGALPLPMARSGPFQQGCSTLFLLFLEKAAGVLGSCWVLSSSADWRIPWFQVWHFCCVLSTREVDPAPGHSQMTGGREKFHFPLKTESPWISNLRNKDFQCL